MQYSTYSGEVPNASGEGRIRDVGVPEILTYICPVSTTSENDNVINE